MQQAALPVRLKKIRKPSMRLSSVWLPVILRVLLLQGCLHGLQDANEQRDNCVGIHGLISLELGCFAAY